MLTKIINEAKKNGRKALIPFLTAGFPAPEKFWQNILELDAQGADIIEIGVPFTDPVADGPVVAAASQKVLKGGVNLQWILDGLVKYRSKIKAGVVLKGYANPFLQYSLTEDKKRDFTGLMAESLTVLAQKLVEAGVNGLIVTDLPLGENDPWLSILSARNIALIPLVGPNTSTERLKTYAANYRGYVYVVSVMGTTGTRETLGLEAEETLLRVRSVFKLPIALGFGLKHPSQLASLKNQAHAPDGLVFGSALMKHLEDGLSVKDFMDIWRCN